MAATRKQRLDVGKAVYEHRITKYEAARQNHVTESCVTNWLKLYLSEAGIPYTKDVLEISAGGTARDYSSMTKEELVHELMLRDIEVARAKKGYEVKGGGGKAKEYRSLSEPSSK
ncbi:MAG: hypothetical protein IJU64_01590 [Bacilli bacterium]|nr:hypothetical protein [Bacilli bacterium]